MLLLRLEEVFPRIGFGEAASSVQYMWPETDAKYRSERHQVLVDLLGEKGTLQITHYFICEVILMSPQVL